jgi:hypothetical protein
MKKLVPLIPRTAAATMLGIGIATVKRWERTDKDFPPPLALSSTRIAYRADDLARYQQVLQQRGARPRPGIADSDRARESALLSVKARRAKRDARLADQQSAAVTAKEARALTDVTTNIPVRASR